MMTSAASNRANDANSTTADKPLLITSFSSQVKSPAPRIPTLRGRHQSEQYGNPHRQEAPKPAPLLIHHQSLEAGQKSSSNYHNKREITIPIHSSLISIEDA